MNALNEIALIVSMGWTGLLDLAGHILYFIGINFWWLMIVGIGISEAHQNRNIKRY